VPKVVTHRLTDVLQRRSAADERDVRWLLCYAPCTWAAVSVLLHALSTHASVVVPESLEPAQIAAAVREDHATHISLTPSHFRRLLLSLDEPELSGWELRQVTFGGEAASQKVLDTARRIWPEARVSHVYATTETGDLCGVSDGLAGIPRHKFSAPRFSISQEGELCVDGQATGDIWELRGERYYFVGRRQELIHVGGTKVSPIYIEEVASTITGVEEARAYGVPSPLVGQLVALDYRGPAEENDVKHALRERLPKVAWPAVVRRCETIELSPAGKMRRGTTGGRRPEAGDRRPETGRSS